MSESLVLSSQNVQPVSFHELLNEALIRTGDPDAYAKTLLSALIRSDVSPAALRPFRPLFASGVARPPLRLVG
jgi:hypothetical protein